MNATTGSEVEMDLNKPSSTAQRSSTIRVLLGVFSTIAILIWLIPFPEESSELVKDARLGLFGVMSVVAVVAFALQRALASSPASKDNI